MTLHSIENRIKTLHNQHAQLDNKIESALKQLSYNEFDVETMKKQKLQIKDQLAQLYRQRQDIMENGEDGEWDE
jgi:hypothetical protein